MLVEKIIWIDSRYKISGDSNNFIYDINPVLIGSFQNLSVELVSAFINKSLYDIDDVALFKEPNPFYSRLIKIYIDFGVGSNCHYKLGSKLLMGVIEGDIVETVRNNELLNPVVYINTNSKACESLLINNIKYTINSVPNAYINVYIYNDDDAILLNFYGDNPESVLLGLKFTYEI